MFANLVLAVTYVHIHNTYIISNESLLSSTMYTIYAPIHINVSSNVQTTVPSPIYVSTMKALILNWQTFPERVTYQNAILMYRIINNICPDYLKSYVSYTSDVSCRDTRSANCNQLWTPKPNCELFLKSTLELPSGILSPYMLKMQLRLTLLNLYI